MTKKHIVGVVVMCVVMGFSVVSYQIVWFPDVYKTEKRVVASLVTTSGEEIVVRQWWNRVDFYSIELEHTGPFGKRCCLIDADSSKWWTCNLKVGVSKLDIIHNGIIVGEYDLASSKLTRANGVEVMAQ